jgi:GLPGLI family protein
MIIRKVFIMSILYMFCAGFAQAQNKTGKVTYKRTQYYINIMSKLPFATEEDIERERLTWGRNEGKWGREYELYFNDGKTLYTDKKSEGNYGYSWKEDEYFLFRDLNKKTIKDLIDFDSKAVLIEDDAPRFKWKILNEIKEIAGYVCMKAETTDPFRGNPVHAWFSAEIPVSAGPEGYGGLPGMILELVFNEDDLVISAQKVEFLSADISFPGPKKYKGKKMSWEEYVEKYNEAYEKFIQSKRNPYWYLRY